MKTTSSSDSNFSLRLMVIFLLMGILSLLIMGGHP